MGGSLVMLLSPWQVELYKNIVYLSDNNTQGRWVGRGNQKSFKKLLEHASPKKPRLLKASMSFHMGATTTAASK